MTPDPFSSRELGGVWARDYMHTANALAGGTPCVETCVNNLFFLPTTFCSSSEKIESKNSKAKTSMAQWAGTIDGHACESLLSSHQEPSFCPK